MHCGLDIAHWHQLTINSETGTPILSSRRLLAILEHGLPETSKFKTLAERGGRWPIDRAIAAESVNEQYRMRASYHAAHSTEENDVRFDPEPWLWVDPVDERLRREAEELEAAQAAETEPELAEAGWL